MALTLLEWDCRQFMRFPESGEDNKVAHETENEKVRTKRKTEELS